MSRKFFVCATTTGYLIYC